MLKSDKISCLDLKGQHQQVKKEIFEAFEKVYEKTAFSGGPFVQEFEEKFSKYVGSKHAIGVGNGTVSLHLAMLALDIGPGDEVIIPANTFIATAWGVSHAGAKPVFCDINLDDLNIDVDELENKITSKTKAILFTNVYGFLCNYDKLNNIAKKHGLYLIEDAAESFGAKYNGKMSGTLGDISTFSFFGNKTITTGEGGMILCKKKFHYEKIIKLKNQGNTNKTYFHDVLGYNYRMTNIQAAIGLGQLNKIDEIISLKKELYNNYKNHLNKKVRFLKNLDNTVPSYWMTPIIFDEIEKKQKIEQELMLKNIATRPFFTPIDNLPFYKESDCESAKKIFEFGLLLPSYPGLSNDDQGGICKIINSII